MALLFWLAEALVPARWYPRWRRLASARAFLAAWLAIQWLNVKIAYLDLRIAWLGGDDRDPPDTPDKG